MQPTLPRWLLALIALTSMASTGCSSPAEPLLLLSTSPIDGTQLSDPDQAIELHFDRPLDPRTVAEGAVQLQLNGADAAVELSLLPGGDRLRVQPKAPLLPASTLRLSLGESLRGQHGEQAGTAFSLTLSTGPANADYRHTMEGSGRTLSGGRLSAVPRAAPLAPESNEDAAARAAAVAAQQAKDAAAP